jgi:hypothetical protein
MSTVGEDSADSKATTVRLPERAEGDARSTATPRSEQLDADEVALRLRMDRAFRSQRPSGVAFDFMAEPGPRQPEDPRPLQSDVDKAAVTAWLQRPLEWDATAMWAWGLPPLWYSALRWWVLKDGSYSEEMLLDVAATETLDLVWLSTTRVSLYMLSASGQEYVIDMTTIVCAGMEIAMAAAWEGKGIMRPRPTAVAWDGSRAPGRANTPPRIQRGVAVPAASDVFVSPSGGEDAMTGRGSPSLTSEKQDGSLGSRVAAGRDRRVQEMTDRLLV